MVESRTWTRIESELEKRGKGIQWLAELQETSRLWPFGSARRTGTLQRYERRSASAPDEGRRA